MRLFAATLATETNTFSPLPTSIEAYKESVFYRPCEHPADTPRMMPSPVGGFASAAPTSRKAAFGCGAIFRSLIETGLRGRIRRCRTQSE